MSACIKLCELLPFCEMYYPADSVNIKFILLNDTSTFIKIKKSYTF